MDKETWLKSIYSDGSVWFVSNPLPRTGEKIRISVQMMENPEVTAVFLSAKFNGVSTPVRMKKEGVRNGLEIYQAEVQVFEKEFQYQFYIATGECIYYYNEGGITTYIPDESRVFRIVLNYEQPEWVKNAVFYQIFPERFCNGNSQNDVKDGEYSFDGFECRKVKDWNSIPETYSKAHCLDFYGGDLEGIVQKIPYLKKLGVTALYLNPIFYAATVHKYDCLDYFSVDPHFGGDKALSELSQELHRNGMKIILDVSINHTGIASRWFNRDGVFFPKTEGAYNNPECPEREFYFFNKDNTYKSWFDVPTLPTLNYTSGRLRSRIYLDKDSLVKKWLKKPYCTDGWRFDVADTMARNNEIQLHHEIWPEIRRSIKEENGNAYILAEDWSDCSEFLNGDEWDSQMNYYGSCRPIRQFYGQDDIFNGRQQELRAVRYKMTAHDLAMQIFCFLTRIPFALRQLQFNLLDSHDVPRFHNDSSISKDSLSGAVIMLFTLPGCANIYYGDEAEIDGTIFEMEGCRYPMPWNKDIESTYSYSLYSKLCSIKTTAPAFKDGGFRIVWDKNYVFAFARFTPEELYITVCSADSCGRLLEIPLCVFGKSFAERAAPSEDVLGSSVHSEIRDGVLYLEVPAGKAFLLKL